MATWTNLADRAYKAVLSSAFVNQLVDNVRWLREQTVDNKTDWVNVPVASGFTPQSGFEPKVRRFGNVVHLRAGYNSSGMSPNATHTVATAGAIPAAFRTSFNMYQGTQSNVPANNGNAVIFSDGSIQIKVPASLGSYHLIDVVYTITGA